MSVTDMQQAVQKLVLSSEVSTKSIREGVEHTIDTANWLKEILNGAAETTKAAQEISLSTQGQQSASEQISMALKEFSMTTSQFVEAGALIRNIAGKLNSLAEELEDATKALKL